MVILVLVSLGSNFPSLLKENTDTVFEVYRGFETKFERIIDAIKDRCNGITEISIRIHT